jgi:hypothetical protein
MRFSEKGISHREKNPLSAKERTLSEPCKPSGELWKIRDLLPI